MAGPTGLEPATSNVTGWRSNQLNYDPGEAFQILSFKFQIKSQSEIHVSIWNLELKIFKV